ncbi:hypothetical protein [Streptomyces lasiicapitis]|uniref:hypothetical protein n=1 Tax=Streptomyces lasiicapitis TaxID=1923961 RepID=UPI0036BD7EA9
MSKLAVVEPALRAGRVYWRANERAWLAIRRMNPPMQLGLCSGAWMAGVAALTLADQEIGAWTLIAFGAAALPYMAAQAGNAR